MKAYPVGAAPIPFSRATLFRWERAGLIKLIRLGGRTLISDETVNALLTGKIAVPEHPRRLGAKQIKPKRHRGRPRKNPEPAHEPEQVG
jgi:hypothetical protein